jgi:hypothetical protein
VSAPACTMCIPKYHGYLWHARCRLRSCRWWESREVLSHREHAEANVTLALLWRLAAVWTVHSSGSARRPAAPPGGGAGAGRRASYKVGAGTGREMILSNI